MLAIMCLHSSIKMHRPTLPGECSAFLHQGTPTQQIQQLKPHRMSYEHPSLAQRLCHAYACAGQLLLSILHSRASCRVPLALAWQLQDCMTWLISHPLIMSCAWCRSVRLEHFSVSCSGRAACGVPSSTSLAAPDQSAASLASSALRRREDAEAHFWVEGLSALHLLGHLYVDAASMHALQIFQVKMRNRRRAPLYECCIHVGPRDYAGELLDNRELKTMTLTYRPLIQPSFIHVSISLHHCHGTESAGTSQPVAQRNPKMGSCMLHSDNIMPALMTWELCLSSTSGCRRSSTHRQWA